MGLSVITGPAAEPISLTEAKAHLRVTDTNEDTLITALITVARGWVENYTRRVLVLSDLEWTLDQFDSLLRLPLSPLRSVVSINYVDESGIAQTLATSVYVVDTTSTPGRIVEQYDQEWPSTYDTLNAVTIRFKAGHVTPFTATAATDTLSATGHTHANGDRVRLSNSGGALPAGLSTLTDYYVVGVSGNALQLSLTQGGVAVDITDVGTGTHYLGELDPEIRAAMLLLIGELYARREDAIVGAPITEVPFSVSALLSHYRVWTF